MRSISLGAVLLSATLAAGVPGGSVAEEAAQRSEPAAGQLDAGRHHTCAVLAGGRVRCWGYGGEGALGYGNAGTIGDDETPGAAGPVDLGAGRTATSISAGHFHTCARLDDGTVRCWGYGANGRLGHQGQDNVGDTETPADIDPVDLGAGRTALAVTAGGFHSCALLNGGDVRCWGYGFYGALGHGGDPNPEPVHVGDPDPPTNVPIDDVGDDEPPGSLGPVNFGAGRKAVAVSAGGYHTCAVLDDGTVRCWGYASNGQLGYGNVRNEADPSTLPAVNLGAGRTAVAISAGDLHTCALLDDGKVRCWGLGVGGRLGYGDERSIGDRQTPERAGPVDLGPGRTAVAITAGDEHTCARLDDGTLHCWGVGASGQLGRGDTNNVGDSATPAQAGPVGLGVQRTALAVSAGGSHTCARLGDGSVSCWGYGGNGRLGYCNQRSIGDDELPAVVGPVPADEAVVAPSAAYPGCARPAGALGLAPAPVAGGARDPERGANAAAALEAQARRQRGMRSCLARAARHARREARRAGKGSARERSRLRRHIRRHRSRKRLACLARHGRTPGRVTGLTARGTSSSSVLLTFRAPGTDGDRPPAARTYVGTQSRRPIRGARSFRRAQTLCSSRCGFGVTAVGERLALTVNDLRARTTYHYAVAARDNVSGRVGPRSQAVRARTR